MSACIKLQSKELGTQLETFSTKLANAVYRISGGELHSVWGRWFKNSACSLTLFVLKRSFLGCCTNPDGDACNWLTYIRQDSEHWAWHSLTPWNYCARRSHNLGDVSDEERICAMSQREVMANTISQLACHRIFGYARSDSTATDNVKACALRR